jgi:Cu+-exporting ATPase
MDTLVSIGTLAAFGWSVVVLVAGLHETVYFDAAAMITTLILLGRYFELRAKRRSAEAISGLLELGAKQARVLRDGEERLVAADALVVGDRFVVRPGERLAADGVVEDGSSEIDASMLTGEPLPAPVAAGDTVTAATINLSGRLVVRATSVGADTTLARIATLVADAQAGKAQVQRLADRVSAVFVPVVGLVALVTLAAWLAGGAGAQRAFTAAVAVIVCACPCALGLATPLALLVAGGRGAQLGIVIGGPEALERTRSVTTVLLDKTGTITTARMSVSTLLVTPGEHEQAVLALAGSAEQPSEHPVAQAIAAHARAELGPIANATSFLNRPGLGVEATVEGHDVLVGQQALLARQGIALEPHLRVEAQRLAASGATVVAVAWDGRARGLVAVADTVKPSAAAAVSALCALGLTPVLLTGDNAGAAQAVARQVGIGRVIAGVLPDGKAAEVARLQAAGAVVAMVGDGVNDAPALARADLGIALGTGSDIAIQAADLTLVSGDPLAAADAIRLARRTLATIRGNLFWAFAYNIAAIPLAATGVLSPILAAAAMSLSSVFVVTNSLRLRHFKPRRTTLA